MTADKKYIEATLMLPVTETQVGLGLKKQKIGADKLNGWGGTLDPGETPLECVVREVFEEGRIQVDPLTLVKVADILFHNEKFDCRVHVYLAPWKYELLQETEEMGPLEWYDKTAIPLEKMMVADREWLPQVLTGSYIRGEFWYGPNQESIEKHILETVELDEL